MAKYLIQGYYTEKGLKLLLKEGGSKRREAVKKAIKSVGGTLESFYYAFGDNDILAIIDIPDNISATAFSLVVNSSGIAKIKTTVLTTPEDIDQAIAKKIDFHPHWTVMPPVQIDKDI